MKTKTTVGTSADASVIELTPKTIGLIEAIRTPFTSYVHEMNAILTRASKLAPAFMRAANAWMGDTGKGFVHFVRELDNTVPVEQKGYRNHSTYNRAVYLKNLVNRPKREKKVSEDVGPPPVPPIEGMARLIAAIAPFVQEGQLPKLWEVIAAELHWSDAQRDRLHKLVEEATPLMAVRAPKGGSRPILRIATPRHSHIEEVAA